MRRRAFGMLGLAAVAATPAWLSRQRRAADPAEAAGAAGWRGLVLPDLHGSPRRIVGAAPFSIVNLWARWCAPCRRELPALQRWAGALSASGVELLTIALEDDRFALREYVRDIGLALPVLLGPPSLQPPSLPRTVLLDAEGRLLRQVTGARDWDRREAQLELLRGSAAA